MQKIITLEGLRKAFALIKKALGDHNKDPAAHTELANKIPTKVSQLTNDSGYITGFTEKDPTVPAWAKQPTKPSYTAAEVGADASGTAAAAVAGCAKKTTHVYTKISTTWGGTEGEWTQTLAVAGVIGHDGIENTNHTQCAPGATTEQRAAYTALQLEDAGQTDGYLHIISRAKTTNEIEVPIKITVQHDA